MKWTLKLGNILDEPADVLICSANVSLNLSGGVGADLLVRYGTNLQQDLHRQIAGRVPHAARQGEVFATTGANMPYQAILHAVAVDPWYHSSSEVISEIVALALQMASDLAARKVALVALGTGYGDLTLAQFGQGVRRLSTQDIPPIEEVVICLPEEERFAELTRAVAEEDGA